MIVEILIKSLVTALSGKQYLKNKRMGGSTFEVFCSGDDLEAEELMVQKGLDC